MATNVQSVNPSKQIKKPAPLPKPNADFYELVETLPAEELAVVNIASDKRAQHRRHWDEGLRL